MFDNLTKVQQGRYAKAIYILAIIFWVFTGLAMMGSKSHGITDVVIYEILGLSYLWITWNFDIRLKVEKLLKKY